MSAIETINRKIAELEKKISELRDQKCELAQEYCENAEKLSRKIHEKIDLSGTDFECITQDILNCYYNGKSPIKYLETKVKKAIKCKIKEIEKLKKFLSIIDKIGGEK